MRVERATCAAVMTAVALLASACGETTSKAGPDEAPTAAASPTTEEPIVDGSVDDPDLAVTPPGKLTGGLATADLLVVAKDTLAAATVDGISNLGGVVDVEQFALGQVSLENELYNLAAVDPATYRRFTPADSAFLQEQWDRVAGGELAISPQLRRRVPIDAEGYLKLGLDDVSAEAHVGAYAPQMVQVDAVVNEKWGAELGIPAGNALAISTGQTAPDEVLKPLREILGEGLSPQRLDAVARYGLDPGAVQTIVLVGTFADAVGAFDYTLLSGGRIAPDPAWVASHIVTEEVPILGGVTCNRYMMAQLRGALADIVRADLGDEINPGEYAGCYYPRFIAGTTSLSNHAFGLAVDINVSDNQRGTVGKIHRGVVAIFKQWGFAWGGDWRYTDPMHFELSRIVRPAD